MTRARKAPETERWDAVVRDVSAVVGELARLVAAATGDRAVVAQLREAMAHASRAGILALPRTRFGCRPQREQ